MRIKKTCCIFAHELRKGTRKVPFIIAKREVMISKNTIKEIVEEFLQGKDYVLADLEISKDNRIVVEIDSYTGVDVEVCAELSRFVEERLDRDKEDYELEVGSVGLTAPFKTKMQYDKHVGHDVEVFCKDGKKIKGMLVSADEESFAVETEQMVAVEGKKRKQKESVTLTFRYDEINYTRYDLKF